ncbi:hypothetical protein CHLNCDRAFT_135933 [Chlorella variabilis]|uniref:P/Homo B domain-containing protein n=1 Tax=Chlorella variabilis TaxID=554065 RepID=E1ZJE5_CHLVA|nr:hypothetical protein CHLNCDRAFT_135933 [Chlorella variabilis]EFN53847.1 hypothetical protein CHLNCDRAFT_135933 [Chlorella variabilis]|eukprot:XP_005845949.1 hypothetical protein CHLNCDRAFT_135933 [Chlorella variabilis]
MARRAAVLLLLAAAAVAHGAAAPGCRTYTSKGLIQPAIGSLQDVVVDAFVAQDASATLDVSHRRITLTAAPFSNAAGALAAHPTIILKSQGLGRKGHNLYRTTFADAAQLSFPLEASFAPFTGTFRPVQKLAFLVDGELPVAGSGGSQGLWTLTVADVAPNNTLRDIALNGWTLQLCDAVQESPAPTPSPSPSPAPAVVPTPTASPPAPAVVSYSGPTDSGSSAGPTTGTGTGTTGTGAAGPSNILGWQVVYRGVPPAPLQPGSGAPAPVPSPAWPPAVGTDGTGALDQLLAQRPLLTLLQNQIAALASGIGGTCDPTCQQAKQSIRLGELQTWLEAHADDTHRLGAWLHDHLRLPTIMVDGQPLQLPAIGDGALLQHLLSSGGDKVQGLLSAFGAAGERIAQLASHFGGAVADRAQAAHEAYSEHGERLASLLASGADRLMGALAAGADRRQELVGGLAAKADQRGEAFQQFMSGLDGLNLGQLSDLSQQGVQDMAAHFAELFDFSNL